MTLRQITEFTMPRGELIDLSLSTDDERPRAQERAKGSNVALGVTLKKSHGVYCESTNIDSEWQGVPSKRRKLKHTLGSNDVGFAMVEDFRENRSSSLPEIAAPTVAKSDRRGKPADPWDSEFLMLSPEERSITSDLNIRRNESRTLPSDESEDSFPENIIFGGTHQPMKVAKLSQRTSALLARLEHPAKRKNPLSEKNANPIEKVSRERSCSVKFDNEELGSQKVQKSVDDKLTKRNKTKLTDEEKAAKAERDTLRAAERTQKAQAKEAALETKRIMKEEKAKQKQLDAALAEVNKSKLDKKITGPEMIVDLPSSIDGQQVDVQIRDFLKNLHIDASVYQSPVPNTIKWRRKVKSRFNATKGHWEIVEPMLIEDDKHVICLMDAKEFVDLASGASQHDVSNIEAHVAKVKKAFEGCKPIYLIEGLHTWMRKNKTMLNRAYRTAVLGQTSERQDPTSGMPQASNSRRKKDVHKHVDEDVIEDALLQLQVTHRCLVHHTTATMESAKWVAIFTQQISMIPSRCFTSFSILLVLG